MQYVPPLGATDPNAPYIEGNPSAGIRGSFPTAQGFSAMMNEICNAIAGLGLTPDPNNLSQLLAGIKTWTNAQASGGLAISPTTGAAGLAYSNLPANGAIASADLVALWAVAAEGGVAAGAPYAATIAQLAAKLAPSLPSYPVTGFWYEGSASGGTANALTTVLNPVPAVAAATAAACAGLNIRMPVTLTDTAASTLTFGVTVNGTPVNIQLPIVLNSTGAALSGGEMTGGANYAADFSIDSLGNARLMNAIGHASIPNIQVIAASGNYVPTSGAKTAIVIATAGGASGGVACGGGGGGGAGETVIGIVPLTGVTSVPCTIGAGGAAVNGIQTIGNNGGNTTFGSYLTAVGGSGGRMPNIAYGLGGLGGSGGTGLFQIPGGDGESSFNSGNAQNGNGGGSYWGGGGVGNYDTQAGGNGRAPGAGGGGSNDWPGGNTSPQVSISGAGAPGVIFVMEF